MNYKNLAVLFFTGLTLVGCDKNQEKPVAICSSLDAQKLVSEIIVNGAEKILLDQKYNNGDFIFDKAKVGASLSQVSIAVESIRTAKEDPNSTKKFCTGSLKMTIPTSMLSDAEQAREMKTLEKISQYARKLNIDESINIFTKKDVEYSVQPTDDGKELFVELESLAWKNLLNEIVSSALLKPVFELEKATENQKKEQVKQEVEKLRQETEQTNLESERLQAMQEKQDADELKKELLDKIAQDKQSSVEARKIDCYDLWYQRNLIFAERGFCFNSNLGKRTFAGYECSTNNPKFSPDEKKTIDQLKSRERQLNCKINTDSSEQVTAESLKKVSPSFDCKKATKPTEITICANSELAALDVENMKAYKKAKMRDADEAATRLKDAIQTKSACGIDVDCIKNAYEESIISFQCVAAC